MVVSRCELQNWFAATKSYPCFLFSSFAQCKVDSDSSNDAKIYNMIWPLASASGGSGGRHLLLLLALLDVLSAKVGIGHGHDHQGKATLNQVFKATTDEKHLFFANSLHSVRIRFEVPGWWWNWSTFCQRRGQLLYFISPWKVLWKPPQFSHVFLSSFGWNFPTILVNPNAFVLNSPPLQMFVWRKKHMVPAWSWDWEFQ